MANEKTHEEALKEAAQKEKRKLTRELKKAEIPAHKMKILEPIIENVSWMRVKLDEAREQIKTEAIVVEYDNGGGQKGLRENPFFKGYEQLWKSYMLGMNRILNELPARIEVEEVNKLEEVAPQTVLGFVQDKHRGTA